MIKLRHTIILTVIIPILLSQTIFAQYMRDVRLPKIPLYLDFVKIPELDLSDKYYWNDHKEQVIDLLEKHGIRRGDDYIEKKNDWDNYGIAKEGTKSCFYDLRKNGTNSQYYNLIKDELNKLNQTEFISSLNLPSYLVPVDERENSFYVLKLEHIKTHYGFPWLVRLAGTALFTYYGARELDKLYENYDDSTAVVMGGLTGFLAGLAGFNAVDRQIDTYRVSLTGIEGRNYVNTVMKATTDGTAFNPLAASCTIPLSLVPVYGQLASVSLWLGPESFFRYMNPASGSTAWQTEFKKNDFLFKQFIGIRNLYKNTNQIAIPINLTDIEQWKDSKLVYLGSPKGEFESTLQYEDRLKKEALTRRSIEAEYQQKIAQRQSEYDMDRLKKYRKIEKLANKVEIERTYDFTLSKYDADRQQFTIHIPALNTSKDLVVPIPDAPRFKKNTGNLVIKQIVKPSLDGRWIPVHDDVVLTDAKTGKIIPWEGEIPTYAATPVANPPFLSVSVDLSEPSGEGYLDAEELATLKVTLTNKGSGPAKTTRISVSQKSGPTLYYDVTATVNSIKPGSSHTERFQIRVPENISNGKVAFTISFLEAQGFEPRPEKFTAQVRAQREPLLKLVNFGVMDQSGDGKVSKGESAEITARIQNRGQGKAKGVSVKVLEDPTKNIYLAPYSEKEFRLGDIPAGESRDVIFTVLTNNRVADLVNVELKLTEKRPRFSKSEYVSLEIDKQQSQLRPLAFTGSDTDVAIADLATLSVDIEKNIPKSKTKNSNALAVVFGVEDYKNVSAATFAKRDASYIKEYFHKTLGIPADKIYYKTDNDVTKGEFDKIFSERGWLDKRVDKNTDIYIYYAGHGAPEIKENKAYLIPYDGDPNYASQTGYALDVLYTNLENLKARSVTVFLDACFSGANRESEILLAGARPLFMEVNPSAAGNITIFSAASGKEISSAWPEKRHGLFSYFLMKGMGGDGDANNDGQLTLDELGSYIKTNVSRQAGFLDREQTPQLKTLDRNKVLVSY